MDILFNCHFTSNLLSYLHNYYLSYYYDMYQRLLYNYLFTYYHYYYTFYYTKHNVLVQESNRYNYINSIHNEEKQSDLEKHESHLRHNTVMPENFIFGSDQLFNCNIMKPNSTSSTVINDNNVGSSQNRPTAGNDECIDINAKSNNNIDYGAHCVDQNYGDDDVSESERSSNYDNTCDNPSRTKLSCMAINVGGLRSKLNFPSFLSFIQNYDVVVVTESKFSDTDSVNIDGYTPFYKNRSKFRRKSGGILLLIKDWLVPWVHIIESIKLKNKITDNQDKYIFVNYELSSRVLFFTVDEKLLGKRVLFCGSYIEGDNSTYFNRHVYSDLEENLLNINFENVVLLGDLNSRTGHLPDIIVNNDHSDVGVEFDEFKPLKRTSKDKQTNTMGYELISFCKANQLAIVNGRLGDDQGLCDLTLVCLIIVPKK